MALLLVLTGGTPALATDATPVTYNADPSTCTVAPRSLDDLKRILAHATPAASPARPATGEPVDPTSADGNAVISTLETLFACLNAGDRLRAYALYTNAYLAAILHSGDLPAAATPEPNDPDELTRIVAIELHTLNGGGIIAKVTLDPALIPVDKIFEFILVPVDGKWKIDAVINEIDFSLP
ncbi:MAG: hypothetical protein E6R14_09145 [Thermomicrobiales bacterium]|nr:MAG: hypothetical protein E6R14_09145 [Thermomicrobiales bacterium]